MQRGFVGYAGIAKSHGWRVQWALRILSLTVLGRRTVIYPEYDTQGPFRIHIVGPLTVAHGQRSHQSLGCAPYSRPALYPFYWSTLSEAWSMLKSTMWSILSFGYAKPLSAHFRFRGDYWRGCQPFCMHSIICRSLLHFRNQHTNRHIFGVALSAWFIY